MTIFDQILIILQVVTGNSLWVLRTITDNRDLVVEGNEANFSIVSSIGHVSDLLSNGSLETLKSAHIGHVSLTVEKLVRTIAELHEIL
jgi:hypothetical protein